ncbi:MAG: DUF1189 domain-containing protein [Chloroflexi bacterium]|nr:DUF1189 domain-containing protein [Chloroflexota bacterium]
MMNENSAPEIQIGKKETGSGCLGEAGWFFSGTILPMGSFSFYRKAAQRSVGSAILFFIVFTLAISTLVTINLAVNIFSVIGGIRQSYADGKIPEITIAHGVAEVNGRQPFILVDEQSSAGTQPTFVAVDTTGTITEIDTSRYTQGFLLTRTELHVYNLQNGYQAFPLSELNTAFEKDPILINAQTMSQAWGVMSTVVVILAYIFLILWYVVVRLMIISMIALILWGIVTLIKPNTGFGPIINTGLYAIVPAIYLSHLFSRSNISFPGLQTFFLLIFWIIGLVANFADIKFLTDELPARLSTALIGLPMLLLFVLDIFWQFPAPYDLVALWSVSMLTGLVLIGLRLYYRFKDQKPATPPAGI